MISSWPNNFTRMTLNGKQAKSYCFMQSLLECSRTFPEALVRDKISPSSICTFWTLFLFHFVFLSAKASPINMNSHYSLVDWWRLKSFDSGCCQRYQIDEGRGSCWNCLRLHILMSIYKVILGMPKSFSGAEKFIYTKGSKWFLKRLDLSHHCPHACQCYCCQCQCPYYWNQFHHCNHFKISFWFQASLWSLHIFTLRKWWKVTLVIWGISRFQGSGKLLHSGALRSWDCCIFDDSLARPLTLGDQGNNPQGVSNNFFEVWIVIRY